MCFLERQTCASPCLGLFPADARDQPKLAVLASRSDSILRIYAIHVIRTSTYTYSYLHVGVLARRLTTCARSRSRAQPYFPLRDDQFAARRLYRSCDCAIAGWTHRKSRSTTFLSVGT